jgi:CHAD domain-containing protein/CYTH domain-containing protein
MNDGGALTDLLDLPTQRACRLVALRMLERLAETRERLRDPADAEALHDFRVALRRLRSWMRAFRPWLAESVPARVRRRLRKLADATSAGRDAEVHLAWIEEQRARLAPRERAGATWLEERLRARKSEFDATLNEAVSARFERLQVPLECGLGEYTMRVSLYGGARDLRFARALAGLVREHAAGLREELASLRSRDDERAVHRARIAGKRLRYLLEPLLEFLPDADPIIARLKTLQDALGAVHDGHVFAIELTAAVQEGAAAEARRVSRRVLAGQEASTTPGRKRRGDPQPGLLALARLLRERDEAAYAEVERDWLGDAAGPFFADVEAVARLLARRPAAGLEIERKYLLSSLPPAVADTDAIEMRQGYLPGRNLVERLRHVRVNGNERWIRTVKGGLGLTRLEVEEETSQTLFDQLWPLTQGRRLTKRRYPVRDGDAVWEIDDFTDRELVLAEIELPDADTEVVVPDWLAPHVVREVTGEREYANATLAK